MRLKLGTQYTPFPVVLKRLGVHTDWFHHIFFSDDGKTSWKSHLTVSDKESQTTCFIKLTEANWMHQTLAWATISMWRFKGWINMDNNTHCCCPLRRKKAGVGQVAKESTLAVWTLQTSLFWYSHYYLLSFISHNSPSLFHWLLATCICSWVCNQHTLLDCIISWIKTFKHVSPSLRSCRVCSSHTLTDFCVN